MSVFVPNTSMLPFVFWSQKMSRLHSPRLQGARYNTPTLSHIQSPFRMVFPASQVHSSNRKITGRLHVSEEILNVAESFRWYSVQVRSGHLPTGSSGGLEGQFRRDLPPVSPPLREAIGTVLAGARTSTLGCWPSSISSANRGVAHPPTCHEGWFK